MGVGDDFIVRGEICCKNFVQDIELKNKSAKTYGHLFSFFFFPWYHSKS